MSLNSGDYVIIVVGIFFSAFPIFLPLYNDRSSVFSIYSTMSSVNNDSFTSSFPYFRSYKMKTLLGLCSTLQWFAQVAPEF